MLWTYQGMIIDNLSRVNGVTITPWSCGRQLAWDAACSSDPQSASNIKNS